MCAKNRSQEHVIGVDVGGTKVAAGIVDAQGKILAQTRASMNCRGSAQDGLTSVLSAIVRRCFPDFDARVTRQG